MKVTKTGTKYSQPPKSGGFGQENSSEHEKYAGAYSLVKIAETDSTNVNESEEKLLERIVSSDNLNEAFKRVKANKGSGGYLLRLTMTVFCA